MGTNLGINLHYDNKSFLLRHSNNQTKEENL